MKNLNDVKLHYMFYEIYDFITAILHCTKNK